MLFRKSWGEGGSCRGGNSRVGAKSIKYFHSRKKIISADKKSVVLEGLHRVFAEIADCLNGCVVT
jgi:hypothetical protein